jgi:hypothetical protein
MKPLCPPHSETLKGRCLVVITEVSNFKEEGLVSPEVGEGVNGILKINCPWRELYSGLLHGSHYAN